MKTLDLAYREVDPQLDLETFCDSRGLHLSGPHRLASYPGSSHWHISRPGLSGVLEVTWWPQRERFWLKVASNRDAVWIEEVSLAFRDGFWG